MYTPLERKAINELLVEELDMYTTYLNCLESIGNLYEFYGTPIGECKKYKLNVKDYLEDQKVILRTKKVILSAQIERRLGCIIKL